MTNRRQAFGPQRQAARAGDARIRLNRAPRDIGPRTSNLFSPRNTLLRTAASRAHEGHEPSPRVVSVTFPAARASFGGRAAGACDG
jgi:hypothetical protein